MPVVLYCFGNHNVPTCSMPILLGIYQVGVVLAVFQNEVSTASEEEWMELDVESLYSSWSHTHTQYSEPTKSEPTYLIFILYMIGAPRI